ncbi:MAG: hypothetical protein R3255_11085 [Candidatus Lokiarchaeia archaeon]|nr:hypothetical protein [Candidatus Lokiarchaeia archaeon]
MKRKVIIFFIIVSSLLVGMIISPLLYNIFVIWPRIYYKIEYNTDLSNREEIIDKVETLDYSVYLHQSYNPDLDPEFKGYVDRDLINFLKERIENYTGFHSHHFIYSLLWVNHSKLYLTYNNNTIFSLKDRDNQSLILKKDGWWEPSWYLNFAQIPHVSGDKSTLELSELIFVEINVDYYYIAGFVGYTKYLVNQYLLLSKNLDVILIFIYYYFEID